MEGLMESDIFWQNICHFHFGVILYTFLQNCDLFPYHCVVQHMLKYAFAQYYQERRIVSQDHKEIILQKCFPHSVQYDRVEVSHCQQYRG